MQKYLVIRLPVLQEDEGRYHVVEAFNTREHAMGWILAQSAEYHGPSDYRIVEIDDA